MMNISEQLICNNCNIKMDKSSCKRGDGVRTWEEFIFECSNCDYAILAPDIYG